ncbi:MAG: alginate export family protein [Paracoccaceae bacterium]
MTVLILEPAMRVAEGSRPLRRTYRQLRVGAAIAALLSGTAIAGHDVMLNGGDEPLIEFASDKPVDADHHLTGSLSIGARLEVKTETEIDFDLDAQTNEDTLVTRPHLEVALAYEPSARFRAYTELELSRELILKDPDTKDAEIQLELKQAYVALRDIVDGVTLTLGRQYMGDEREWLLDEELDGAELILRSDGLALELSYGREGIVRRDLLMDEEETQPDYFIARGFAAVGEDSQASAFALYQDGHEGKSDEDLLFLGVQSFGDLGNHVDFWADGAAVFGEAQGREVRGFGFDVGVTKTFKELPMRPYLTAGAAFGSGDDGSGNDTAFRQSGLHGNSDRFGGVTSLHYYGEVLDPELSNLAILTLGAGIRPTPRSSVDLVYHRYRQHRREDDLRDVSIDADPDGRSRHIGDEIDLIIGIKEIGNIDLELVGGAFMPGRAFEDRDPALFGGITVQFKF